MKRLLEAGKIVNTHGVRGEVKIQPWANSPSFLLGFERFFIDGVPVAVRVARVHGGCVIAALEGVNGIGAAQALKNKVVCIDRAEASLPEGEHFIQDIEGLAAIDADTGREFGTVSRILPGPAHDVYVIRGEREILVPAVPQFVKQIDIDGGRVFFALIEGM